MAVLLLAALLGALILPGAWKQTERREAFLPSLEAQALKTPDDGSLLALVGACRLQAGEDAGAADALRRALADGEGGEAIWRTLAAAVAASGDRTRAIADLRLGIKALPSSLALQGALAQARSTDPVTPPAALALAIAPQGPTPLLDQYGAGSFLNPLAQWWGRRHPAQSGLATRQAWASSRPGDAQAQRLWGEALLENRRLPEASAALSLALSLDPSSPDTHLALGQVLHQGGASTKAALQYLACLAVRPSWLPALLGFGASAFDSHLNQDAIRAYTRATQVAPQNADAWIGLGRVQARLLGAKLAVADFANAARLAPARTDYLNEYADAQRLSGNEAEAEALLRRRLTAVPDDALAHYLLGRVLRDSNPTPARVAEAERETRESIRLSPHNPLAETQLGQLLLDRGRTAEALILLSDALTRTPADPALLLLLAHASQKAGRTADSARFSALAQALSQDRDRANVLADQSRHKPLDIGLHRQLAALYTRTGQPDKARTEADTARLLETDPSGTARQMDSFEAQVQKALGGT